jgi:hypothetical protein
MQIAVFRLAGVLQLAVDIQSIRRSAASVESLQVSQGSPHIGGQPCLCQLGGASRVHHQFAGVHIGNLAMIYSLVRLRTSATGASVCTG